MQETNLSEALKNAQKFRDEICKTIGDLTAKKSNIDAQIKGLTERNKVLWRMPLSRSDAKAAVLKAIDRIGHRFIEDGKWRDSFRALAFPQGLRPNTGGAVSLNPSSFLMSTEPINLQDVEVFSGPSFFGNHIFGDPTKNLFTGAAELAPLDSRMVYFFLGDLIKAKVEKHFDALFPALSRISDEIEKAEALSIEDRRAEISLNTAKIAELTVDLESIEGQLNELSKLGSSMRELHAPQSLGALGAVL